MKIFKKLFGKQSEESNKPVEENTLDIDQPMIYTIVVDDAGEVSFYFQCKDGYEESFGDFINQLLSGVYDEQIILGMDSIFDKDKFSKIVKGMQDSAANIEQLQKAILGNQVDIPVIMPSQVFSEVKRT